MSTAYFYLTGEGEQLARKLAASHPGDLYDKETLKQTCGKPFTATTTWSASWRPASSSASSLLCSSTKRAIPESLSSTSAVSTPSACCPVTWAAPTIWQGKWLPSPAAKPSSPPPPTWPANCPSTPSPKNTTWPSKTSGSSNTSAAPSSPDRRSASSQTGNTRNSPPLPRRKDGSPAHYRYGSLPVSADCRNRRTTRSDRTRCDRN